MVYRVESEDSDGAPEEYSLKESTEISKDVLKSQRDEIQNAKKLLKRSRQLRQEQNIEQKQNKLKKLKQLEELRLPDSFLAEAKNQINVSKNKKKSKSKKRSTRIKFGDKEDLFDVSLNEGSKESSCVEIETVENSGNKSETIMKSALDFRENRMDSLPRNPSKCLRQQLAKQKASGKNIKV